MSLKDKLEIIIITYNRKKYLKRTFEQILSNESPIKNFDICVLDNASTDGTDDLIKELQENFPNITYIKRKRNIGGSANVASAITSPTKKYGWILCDDDIYDWSNWKELEQAINDEKKMICVSRYGLPDKYKNDTAHQLLQMTFIPSIIYKTELLTDEVTRNIFDNIYTLFPQGALVNSYINTGGKIFVLSKALVINGILVETDHDMSYTRGNNSNLLYRRSWKMSWIVGYANICSILKNKQLKYKALDIAIKSEQIHGSKQKFYKYLKKQYNTKEDLVHLLDLYLNIGYNYRPFILKHMIKIIFKINFSLIGFIQHIFSVKNENEYKIITILGCKIKFKRKYKNDCYCR